MKEQNQHSSSFFSMSLLKSGEKKRKHELIVKRNEISDEINN